MSKPLSQNLWTASYRKAHKKVLTWVRSSTGCRHVVKSTDADGKHTCYCGRKLNGNGLTYQATLNYGTAWNCMPCVWSARREAQDEALADLGEQTP